MIKVAFIIITLTCMLTIVSYIVDMLNSEISSKKKNYIKDKEPHVWKNTIRKPLW